MLIVRETFIALELFEKNVVYHERCYASFANIGKVEHAKKGFHEFIEIGESSVIKQKAGRPSLNTSTEVFDELLVTRSKSEVYDKQSCIISQEPGRKVH